MVQLKLELREKLEKIYQKKQYSEDIWLEFNTVNEWLKDALKQMEMVKQVTIYRQEFLNFIIF